MAAPRLTITLFSSYASFFVSPSLIWRGFLVTLGQAASTTARPASTTAPPRLHSARAPRRPPRWPCPPFGFPRRRRLRRALPAWGADAFAAGGFGGAGLGLRYSGAGLPFQRGGLPFQRLGRVYKCKNRFDICKFTFVMLLYNCNRFAPSPRKVLRGSSPLPSMVLTI